MLKSVNQLTPVFSIPAHEEGKLRALANELAKDILEPEDILKSLGMTIDDYEAIKETRAFRMMYTEALSEWNSAANTQKRAKLKAASTVESALPTFWKDFENPNETLNARVGLLTILAKIGGLGLAEPTERSNAPGQTFKLEIHLANKETITVEANAHHLTDESQFDAFNEED